MKHILFDLDGTLLGMDIPNFMKLYYGALGEALRPCGYDPKVLLGGVTDGLIAMQKNDGSARNEEVFWRTFERSAGGNVEGAKAACDRFYAGDFYRAKAACHALPDAREAVRTAREKGLSVVLATNPVFPRVAVLSRLDWAGLRAEDFDYITTYETSRFCKPDPRYYEEILQRLGYDRAECRMVGNDETEDMFGCTRAGIEGFLVTDELIPSEEHPFAGRRGTLAELVGALKAL